MRDTSGCDRATGMRMPPASEHQGTPPAAARPGPAPARPALTGHAPQEPGVAHVPLADVREDVLHPLGPPQEVEGPQVVAHTLPGEHLRAEDTGRFVSVTRRPSQGRARALCLNKKPENTQPALRRSEAPGSSQRVPLGRTTTRQLPRHLCRWRVRQTSPRDRRERVSHQTADAERGLACHR